MELRYKGGVRSGHLKRLHRQRKPGFMGKPSPSVDSLVPRKPETLDDVVEWASWLVHAAATGRIDVLTARQISVGLGQLRSALEKRDLGRQVAAIRQDLEQVKRKRG
jgi:hypothetical protein